VASGKTKATGNKRRACRQIACMQGAACRQKIPRHSFCSRLWWKTQMHLVLAFDFFLRFIRWRDSAALVASNFN
jgi:hypothetical protein